MSPELAYVISSALVVTMKVVCFILGYLIVRLGYTLIASGVKGEFKFSASMGGAKADLASVSPGLLFVLLGVLLIGYAIYVKKEVVLEPTPEEFTSIAPPPEVKMPSGSPFANDKKKHPIDEKGETAHEIN